MHIGRWISENRGLHHSVENISLIWCNRMEIGCLSRNITSIWLNICFYSQYMSLLVVGLPSVLHPPIVVLQWRFSHVHLHPTIVGRPKFPNTAFLNGSPQIAQRIASAPHSKIFSVIQVYVRITYTESLYLLSYICPII